MTLLFECPRTHREIDAGIQTDKDTLAAVSSATLKLSCPHCDSTHELPIKYGRLSDLGVLDESETSKAPVLAVAINALRIFWLRRGLSGPNRHA